MEYDATNESTIISMGASLLHCVQVLFTEEICDEKDELVILRR